MEKKFTFNLYFLAICLFPIILSSCGTITGIPSHGGGKKYAVEQEMISSTAYAVAENINLKDLKGKSVRLFFASIGDQGAGNLNGGRLTLSGLISGISSKQPEITTYNNLPQVKSSGTVTTGNTSTITSSTNVLEYPEKTITQESGEGYGASAGMKYDGLGAYNNGMIITNPVDTEYLSAVIQSHFVKNGINLVSSDSDVNVYITVDVFGTIRSRTDWLLFNKEQLTAKTAIQVDIFNAKDRILIGKTQSISYEATYNENYILWTGPYKIDKSMHQSEGILTTPEASF